MTAYLAALYSRHVLPLAVRLDVWALRTQAEHARRRALRLRWAGDGAGAARETARAVALGVKADLAAAWLAGRAGQ